MAVKDGPRAHLIESRIAKAVERFKNHKATPQMLAQIEATVRDELLYLMREGKLWGELEDAIRRTGISDNGTGEFTVELDPVMIAYLRGLKDAGGRTTTEPEDRPGYKDIKVGDVWRWSDHGSLDNWFEARVLEFLNNEQGWVCETLRQGGGWENKVTIDSMDFDGPSPHIQMTRISKGGG